MPMNKYLSQMIEDERAVTFDSDPYLNGIRSPSPSVNFIFGNTHLIPDGTSVIFWGPPGGGKSLLSNAIIGQIHKDDPDSVVVKINTEFREKFQMTPFVVKAFGIDLNRYLAVEKNKATDVFNFIEHKLPLLIEKGVKIRAIVIDSISDIVGRRTENAKGVETQQMADEAASIKDGLKRIKSFLKENGITVIMVAQERAVLDAVEQMRGNKTQMAGAFYLKHFAEYFVYVQPNLAKEGKTNEMGKSLSSEDNKDVMGGVERHAHKIKVTMTKNSLGVAKRSGEFVWDTYRGIRDRHEELYRLGCARRIFIRPNNRTYILKDFPEVGKETKWTSKEDCILGILKDPNVAEQIEWRVREKDIQLYKNGIIDEEEHDTSSDAEIDLAKHFEEDSDD